MKARDSALRGGAVLVVVASFVLVGCGSDQGSSPGPAHTGQPGRITQMEASGEMRDMLERHRQMLERMQQDASPAMLELMNNDPMWQMMRSEEWARLDEEHQEDIDRMLGTGQP